MLKRYDVESARSSILKRIPLDEMPVPQALLDGIARLFGEALTPEEAVARILKDVRLRGDEALYEWSARLDGSGGEGFVVPPAQIQKALDGLDSGLRVALAASIARVEAFHRAQPLTSWLTQNLGGTLGQMVRPIRRVGLYIPSGTAPLPSSLIMTAVIARVAGVGEIALVTPPERGSGRVSPIILATAALLGIDEVYALGGAQAVAALAYGTRTVRAVDKIYGPGNLFVTLAKRRVFGTVGIDSIAGPTETVVIADDSAHPAWVAADLLAQAEHDTLAAAILLSPSEALIEAVQNELARQLPQRSRQMILAAALDGRSGAVLTADLEEALLLANAYAPEHLCLSVRAPWALVPRVTSAGGVFLGDYSCEVLGDYAAGPSHVMPTGGSARFASPLNVLDFVHFVSLVALDESTSRQVAATAAVLAHAEGLDAHENAARVRL